MGRSGPDQSRTTRYDRRGEASVERSFAESIAVMEADLARLARELRISETRLKAVVDAPMIVFAFDRDGVFTMSEGGRLDVLGLEPGEVVGRSVFEMYRDVAEVVDQCRQALAGNEVLTTGVVNDVVLETRYVPVRDETGRVDSVIGISTDITERRRNEERIAFLAYHDPLTSLANRARLDQRLDVAVGRAGAIGSERRIAVCRPRRLQARQ